MAVPQPRADGGDRTDRPARAESIREVGPTVVLPAHETTEGVFLGAPNDRPSLHVRLFGSTEFFRLWLVQLVGATGDWLGMFAVIYLAQSLYPEGSNARAAATSLVIGVRLLPHLFLSPIAGVIVDRFNRRTVMVVADLSRVPLVLLLLFARNLLALVVVSILLEGLTLVWTPSKEAITPHLVPYDHLTTASSLNMAAGFGSFLPGSIMFAILAGASAWLASFTVFGFLSSAENQITLPLLFDAASFLFSAAVLWRLPFPDRAVNRPPPPSTIDEERAVRTFDVQGALRAVKEGWHYVFLNHTVRAVTLSLGVALIGGGMLIPLAAVFSSEALDAGAAGYGVFTSAIGFGVAAGVVGVSTIQKRLAKTTVFSWGLMVSGAALFGAVASNSLTLSVALLFVTGATAGPVYVLGYSLLHENVSDEMRGRVFAGLNTMVRMCVFLALVVGPLLSAGLDALSSALVGRSITVGAWHYDLPGVRLTLWLDALLIVGAGLLARHWVKLGELAGLAKERRHPASHVHSRSSPPESGPPDGEAE